MNKTYYQRGVTSIFVVIFAAMLFSVITLSFAGLMAREQQRSSDDELSQSAYDSAMAGVEDAKRVILAAREGDQQAQNAINAGLCNTVAAAGITGDPNDPDVVIKSSSSDTGELLQQAYTCVKIGLNSNDYRLELNEMESEIVPLKATGSFNRIRISWHKPQSSNTPRPCDAPNWGAVDPGELCPANRWSDNAPALLRTQIINPGASISYSDLNSNDAGNTVFLYPASAGLASVEMGDMERFVTNYNLGTLPNETIAARCDDGAYYCQQVLDLARPVPAQSELALLRLTPIYTGTNVMIELFNGGTRVQFDGVQPTVDSTGRANDLFRRVDARLSLATEYSYPEAALDIEGSLCKNFYVTRDSAGWFDSTHCNP